MCDFPAKILAQLAYKYANPTGPLFGKYAVNRLSLIEHIVGMGRDLEELTGCPCLQEELHKLGLGDKVVDARAYTKYAIIPTAYKGVRFRSRLEAWYAAFFDLLGWMWEYEPIDLKGWTPDFRVTIPCWHSKCSGSHILLVEVKPYSHPDDFKYDPKDKLKRNITPEYKYAMEGNGGGLDCDAVALFGRNPDVSYWQMVHAGGSNIQNINTWFLNWGDAWKEAGNRVQWKKSPVSDKRTDTGDKRGYGS